MRLLSKFAVHINKKIDIYRKKETSGLLNSLGIKKTLSKIFLAGPLFFGGINISMQRMRWIK